MLITVYAVVRGVSVWSASQDTHSVVFSVAPVHKPWGPSPGVRVALCVYRCECVSIVCVSVSV